jgi:SAM-dependent methyltransferase
MLSEVQKVFAIAFALLLLNYLLSIAYSTWRNRSINRTEGFEDAQTLYTWEDKVDLIYDDFYAKTYDQLTQNITQTKGKTDMSVEVWRKEGTDPSSWTILDAGSGTGVGCIALAKRGVGSIIGIDVSPAMIKHAETIVIPKSTLSEKQKDSIHFRKDTLLNPSACSPGEVHHTMCQYFTFYYLEDKEAFLRNVYLWTKPGGSLHLEVVNKHKFDPVLESANPILGFSLQKYHEERLKKSKVSFDTFDYEAEFLLTDPQAEFRETFRFKNNRVRRQKHMFIMPDIEQITKTAQAVGWKYEGYLDLVSIGFEYGYILMFKKTA